MPGPTVRATADPVRRPGWSVLIAAALAAGSALGAIPDGIALVVSKQGFRPKQVRVHKGETVRLLVTTSDEEHCFALDAFHVEKRILPGKTATVELSPERIGSFPFYCCLEPKSDLVKGELVVTE